MSLDVDLTIKEWKETTVFNYNITHNLHEIAEHAGLYKALWRPEELKINKAGDLIPYLESGLQLLKDSPEHFKQFNPSNGWGKYENLVDFVEEYLKACREYPEAMVSVSR